MSGSDKEGEPLELDGDTITGHHDFGVLPERGGVTVHSGDAAYEVARRGGFDVLRPRHPGNPLRTSFVGTPTFAPTPEWVVTGYFSRFVRPRPTTVGAAVEGLEHVYEAVGEITFEAAGRSHTLTAFPGQDADRLLVLFSDETAGVTTHPAVRALAVDASDGDRVVLDFNRATNLPCAYTPHATCPFPPLENRLSIAVTAGEQLPTVRVWHGSATSRESVDLAAKYGAPLFSANVTNPIEPYAELIRYYRERWAHHGHDPAALTVGAGTAGVCVRARSQDARATYTPAFAAYLAAQRRLGVQPVFTDLDDYVTRSSALVGSPDEVIEKVARYHAAFGHSVLHIGADAAGVSEADHLRSLELFAEQVQPVLRREFTEPARWGPGPLVDDAQGHAEAVSADLSLTG